MTEPTHPSHGTLTPPPGFVLVMEERGESGLTGFRRLQPYDFRTTLPAPVVRCVKEADWLAYEAAREQVRQLMLHILDTTTYLPIHAELRIMADGKVLGITKGPPKP